MAAVLEPDSPETIMKFLKLAYTIGVAIIAVATAITFTIIMLSL